MDNLYVVNEIYIPSNLDEIWLSEYESFSFFCLYLVDGFFVPKQNWTFCYFC
jgi:hypothetical protein